MTTNPEDMTDDLDLSRIAEDVRGAIEGEAGITGWERLQAFAEGLESGRLRVVATPPGPGVPIPDEVPGMEPSTLRAIPPPQPGTCPHTEHVRVRRMVGRKMHPEWRGRVAVGEPWESCKEPPQPGTVILPADVVRALLRETTASEGPQLIARRALADADG